jgi:deoxyribodipyrimidine photo-lyase
MVTPAIRIRPVNDRPVNPGGDFVLYWMIAARRLTWNYALDRAIEHARALKRPLVVLEALRCDYPWASDRLHRFVLDGMADNARRLTKSPVRYYPYVEPARAHGRGLLAALASRSAAIVTDDYPCFFLSCMIDAAGRQSPVRLEAVDSNGLVPIRSASRAFPTAHAFRAFIQRTLREHLAALPSPNPLEGLRLPAAPALPRAITDRWPAAPAALLDGDASALARLPIDHVVGVSPVRGGATQAARRLDAFLEAGLRRYADDQAQPEADATSRLSPYLHFGHISAHEVFSAVMTRERWTTRRLGSSARGARQGWWGVSVGAEAFLDQLITWRELGFNGCAYLPRYDRYESLPAWARRTLEAHRRDRRPYRYTLEEFEGARTHDALWNAAQTHMVEEGWFPNYLRMLWGKKILEWSATPEDALATMIALMNRHLLDGRDPNTYSGIFWTLGRYDRAWGPEREIFGTVRYMSSENTARKLKVKEYIRRWTR